MTLEFTGGHLIGGSNPREGNLISGNAGFSIELNGDASGSGTGADNNVIEGNRIGTDAAVTDNDLGDTDSGPNGLLNWPFIYQVSESGGAPCCTS